jgi:hypothetical protein
VDSVQQLRRQLVQAIDPGRRCCGSTAPEFVVVKQMVHSVHGVAREAQLYAHSTMQIGSCLNMRLRSSCLGCGKMHEAEEPSA